MRFFGPAAKHPVDPWLLWITIGLTVLGFIILTSASIGLLAREGAQMSTIVLTRLLATLAGACAAYVASVIDYRLLRKYALAFLLASMVLAGLVFVPEIGVTHGGAQRWISLFGLVTFQPSELLKVAFVIYAAALFAAMRDRIATITYGFIPLIALLCIAGLLLLLQPDTDTFIVLFLALVGQFLVANGRFRHLAVVFVGGALVLSLLIFSRPYLMARITTFIYPGADLSGAGYQVNQSLIAIGSGGLLGKGFGQSVQKFSYLPEPIGDSIFAIAGEEFGFVGSVFLVMLFLALILRGLRTGARAPDLFSGLLSTGIVILIGASAFMNMASMLAIIPLSGLPLSFVSHGGTALFIALAEVGILLNISRYQRS
jgi:cell division protein FtsW